MSLLFHTFDPNSPKWRLCFSFKVETKFMIFLSKNSPFYFKVKSGVFLLCLASAYILPLSRKLHLFYLLQIPSFSTSLCLFASSYSLKSLITFIFVEKMADYSFTRLSCWFNLRLYNEVIKWVGSLDLNVNYLLYLERVPK